MGLLVRDLRERAARAEEANLDGVEEVLEEERKRGPREALLIIFSSDTLCG